MKTKKQMRRAIARDVILQLNEKQLIPTPGTYTGRMMGSAMEAGVKVHCSLQPYLLKKRRKPCTVCALGAGLVAMVRLENKLALHEYFDIHERLNAYFSLTQINTIENLFEGFGDRPELLHLDPEARLRWLWSYVAKHPGFTAKQMLAAAVRLLHKKLNS